MNPAKFSCFSTFLVSLSLLLSACGGGGGSDTTNGPTNTQTTNNVQSSQEPSLQQGQFVDSAVSGLWYETETQSGYTDANGYFLYLDGETVTFYLGQTVLGSVETKELVTPLDMLSEDDHPDKLQNMLRMLQTLDADSDSSNGIEINETTTAYLSQFSLPLNDPAFLFEASEAVNDIISAVTNGSGLIDAVDSFVHFRETLLSARRETEGEVILNLLNTNWDAEVTSTACESSETASLVYSFNLLGVTTMGHHRLEQMEDEFGDVSCQPAGNALLFNTYETDEIFTCANECTEADLNRVMVDQDEFGEVVTTLSYDLTLARLTITVSYFDGAETQTTSTVLVKRS